MIDEVFHGRGEGIGFFELFFIGEGSLAGWLEVIVQSGVVWAHSYFLEVELGYVGN